MATVVTVGNETRVNTTTVNDQMDPAIAVLDGGGRVVTWTSAGQDGSGTGVYQQRYDASGVPVGGETLVNTTTAGDQLGSSVASLGAAGYVVTWGSINGGSGNVYAQRFDTAGVPVGTEILVTSNSGPAIYGIDTDVTAVPGGGFAVIRSLRYDDGNFGQPISQVTVRFFDSAGAGGTTRQVAGSFGDLSRISIDGLSDGTAVYGYFNAFNSINVYSRVNAAGTNTFVDSISVPANSGASVLGLSGGGYVVSWSTSTDVNTRTYNAANQIVGSNVVSLGEPSTNLAMAALSGGGYVMVFQTDVAGTADILAQRYTASGEPVGGILPINSTTADTQSNPSVAAMADNGFVVTWDSAGQDGSGAAIVSRAYTGAANGTLTNAVELVDGTTGDDLFLANPGALGAGDRINAFVGTDTIQLNAPGTLDITAPTEFNGIEVLAGSSGDDTFVVNATRLAGITAISGGTGTDTVSVSGNVNLSAATLTSIEAVAGSSGNDNITLSAGQVAGLTSLSGGAGVDTLNLASAGTADFGAVALSGFEMLNGSGGDDTFVMTGAQIASLTAIDGGSGTDTLRLAVPGTLDITAPAGFNGIEALAGSTGDDTFVVNATRLSGIASISGGGGTDTITLAGGTIDLSGATLSSIEAIAGSAGDDALTLAGTQLAGLSSLSGGSGDDALTASAAGTFDLSAIAVSGFETLNGSSGNDVLVLTAAQAAGLTSISGGAGMDALRLATAGTLNATLDAIEILEGSTGADTFVTNETALSVIQTINGGAGSDTLTLTTSANLTGQTLVSVETLDGAANSVLTVTSANLADVTTLNGNGGSYLIGDFGAFTGDVVLNFSTPSSNGMVGNTAVSGFTGGTITAGSGADTLTTGAGSVSFYAGAGDDTLVSIVVGNGYLDGGDGIDLAIINRSTSGRSFNLDLSDPSQATSLNDGTTLINIERANFTAGSGNDNLVGGLLADTLSGGAGRDFLDGRDGDDVLSGGDGLDILTGGIGNDLLNGDGGADTLSGDAGNDTLNGGAGSDTFYGDDGNDLLDGGTGVDTMVGGAGDDVFIVDDSRDVVVETAGEGNDTVRSTASYTLTAEIETVQLLGAAVSGTGNESANLIDATAQGSINNVLAGGTGNDTLRGGSGNDDLAGGAGADVLDGGAGFDVVRYDASTAGVKILLDGSAPPLGGDALGDTFISIEGVIGSAQSDYLAGDGNANLLSGLAGNDVLFGGAGDDTLDGGAGADEMTGGVGNDTYVIDDAGDVVIERAGEGFDFVTSSISYTLRANFENLALSGFASLTAGGNDIANIIFGNAGNNVLDGGAGGDTMYGGVGDDIFVVENVGDVVVEYANEGTDTVNSFRSFALGDNFENLTLFGTANLGGTGNALANVIIGNAGSNTIDGGAGADTMLGGLGNDLYTVDNLGDIVAEGAGEGIDTVFSSVSFALGSNIENMAFLGIGAVNGSGNDLNNLIVGSGGANVLDGLGGRDTLVGADGNDTFVFRRGQSNGDEITDFTGNGAAAGDNLRFVGYGTAAQGVTFTQVNGTQWSINSADGFVQEVITLSNGASVHPSDYVFV